MCQPGRPWPQGLSHDGSPGLADFHRAKSAGVPFARRRLAAFAVHRLDCCGWRACRTAASLADVEVHVAVGGVSESSVDQRLG